MLPALGHLYKVHRLCSQAKSAVIRRNDYTAARAGQSANFEPVGLSIRHLHFVNVVIVLPTSLSSLQSFVTF